MNKYDEKIRSLLSYQPTIVKYVDFQINNYEEVLTLWENFKKGIKTNIKMIDELFQFHCNTIDHIVLYYSKGQIGPLLLCRIQKKYINLVIKNSSQINFNNGFIATYC